MKEKEKVGGFTTNSLVIPLGIVLAVLIVAIALLTVNVNVTTSSLADLMQQSSDQQQTATQLQAGTSVLSEISTGFVQSPVIQGGPEAGTLNVGPLHAYVQELAIDRRAPEVAELFRGYDVSDEVQGYIDAAAASSVQMQNIQTHAISLIVSVYPLPDDPELSTLPLVGLTAEETAMPNEARVSKAQGLIFAKDYSLLKSSVTENIEKCHAAVQEQFTVASTKCKRDISAFRIALWSAIGLIIIVLLVTFFLFYRWIVMPLRQYSKDMASDKMLKRKGHTRELRSMVTVYNELLERRNNLENILRTAAETDSLTGLPNRYHLEQNILDLDKKEGSLVVLLFDVNFLKVVNDTKGHMEGDKLLRKTANIIHECFGVEDAANCYRIGGDEFAAILLDCTEDELKARIENFSKALVRDGISVSVGYAIDKKADTRSFHRLMALADKQMYKQKKEIHALFANEA